MRVRTHSPAEKKHSDNGFPCPVEHVFCFIYAMCGLVVGLFCIVGGIILLFMGVSGSASWTASFLGLTSEINDAGPGIILFVVGLFFVSITRYKKSHLEY